MSEAIATAAEAGCPFCKMVMEYVASGVGIEQIGVSGVYHFEPLNPVAPGHRLFVPAFHYEDAAEAPSATGAVFEWAAWWAAKQGEDFNLIVNAGRNASQTVRHLHVHYVPRRPGDGLILPWSSLAQKRAEWEAEQSETSDEQIAMDNADWQARLLPDPKGGCCCTWHSQDAGGGYTEYLMEYEPACPEHSTHVYNPRTGVWEHAERGETEWEYATGAESRDKPGTYWVEDKARSREQAESWLAEYREMGTFANALLLRRRKSPWEPATNTESENKP